MDDGYILGFADMEEVLQHYGVGHPDGGHSGRYPWGSGENPYQHQETGEFFANKFLARYNDLKKQGLNDHDIFVAMGLSEKYVDDNGNVNYTINSGRIRAIKDIAKDEVRRQEVERAKELFEKLDHNYSAVAREMGKINKDGKPQDTSIKKLLDEDSERRMNVAKNTADILRKEVKAKKFVDVGKEVNRDDKLGVSENMMDQALEMLKMEGYAVYSVKTPQVTNPGKYTTIKVLCKDDPKLTETQMWSKLFKARDAGLIQSVGDFYSEDGGKTFNSWHYPESLDSKRLQIVPSDKGGIDRDGLIELRKGVEDLSLGDALYSQVRIMVDDKYYLKGMAAYANDLPEGVDVRFNSNKPSGTPLSKVLKELKGVNANKPLGPDNPIDINNPFGSAIKEGAKGQRWYDDPTTGEKKLSLINKRADEGDWSEWSNSLPSQFLSKQGAKLIKSQLDLARDNAKTELAEINSLTNSTIKKYYLEKFASECDKRASDLSAAALPGQKYQVLMPVPSLGKNEVHAPNYPEGSWVALIRFPHSGPFEIVKARVNNSNREAIDLVGRNAKDVVCTNPAQSHKLSGADWDGDTALVIPITRRVDIEETPSLRALEGFEAKEEYATKEVNGKYVNAKTGSRCKLMAKGSIQTEMGKISNLITDMYQRGAPLEAEDGVDIAHAVRHSMTVIDAYKHKLDYQASAIDNHIKEMQGRWQTHYDLDGNLKTSGASTIISRAGASIEIPERRGQAKINKETGEEYYKESGRTYNDWKKNPKTGEYEFKGVKEAKSKVHQMDVVKDAYQLVSPDRTAAELLYADYANSMKALANEARKEMVTTKDKQYTRSAKEAYRDEVASLNVKLNDALKNAPRERRAQIIAGSIVKQQKIESPGLTREELKKLNQKAIQSARQQVGSIKRSDRNITVTDREWEAIQAGAFPATNLRKILDNTDPDALRQRAMPKQKGEISDSIKQRIKNYARSGTYSNARIAELLNVSVSTVNKYAKGVD